MILDPSMKTTWTCPSFMAIIPKTTFAVLNFVFLSPRKCKLADGTSASAVAPTVTAHWKVNQHKTGNASAP